MLVQMNVTLDADRRSLMDHVTCLLAQYHELLAHSMEDKQHYHQEEKMLTDKLNNLCRQKEKLEEKIMEHYRKLDNCTSKKKTNWVKRVYKAGSDLINKVPSRNNRRSWSVDENSKMSHSQVTLGGSESDESDITHSEDPNKTEKSSAPGITIDRPNSVSAAPSVSSLESPRHSADNSFVRKLSHSSFHGSLGGGDDALIRASLRRRQNHKLGGQQLMSGHRNSFQGFDGSESPTNMTAALGLCRAGSRRAVYLAEDNSQASLTSPVEAELESNKQSPEKPENPSTFLVYNKISTIIGDGAVQTFSQPELLNVDNRLPNPLDVGKDDKDTNKSNKSAKETAIWYEYGCV
jgi:hypothetical protein